MKISDSLLNIIYKNGGSISTPQLLNYINKLIEYDCVCLNKNNLSFTLTNKGKTILINNNLI